jgi:hypothetical protein
MGKVSLQNKYLDGLIPFCLKINAMGWFIQD